MDNFLKEIENFKNQDIDLFYNSEGNQLAYKNMIRHISYAPNLLYGIVKNNLFIPSKDTYLVDFENMTINILKDPIEVISLEVL